LVGSLLIAYAEIEFALFCLVDAILDTQDNAVQIFFRIRGESARIEISDAILRPFLEKVGLGPKWTNVIGPLRICKKIRNQYAHCHWMLVDEQLHFVDFDSSAEKLNDKLIYWPINVSILKQQFAYFHYSLDWLYFLAAEYRVRAEQIQSHDYEEPKSMAAPPLHLEK
jgi:hypothetical protein